MHIVVGTEAADALRENYTVLELETFPGGKAYCIVSAENMPVLELPDLEKYKSLHAEFIREYNNKNYKFCLDLAEHLKGRFGGELDSFYDIIVDRISTK